MSDISYTFHLVNGLPHGAAVLRVEDDSECRTYIDRGASPEDIVAGLEVTMNALMAHYVAA